MSCQTDAEFQPGNRHAESLLILISAAILAASILSAEPLQSANDRSRWATVWSLVERGTYQIDEIDQLTRFRTIDKVRHRLSEDEPWHFYSSKPPLLSTIVAGLYWVERHTIGLGLFQHTAFVVRLLLMFVNWLPMCLALLSLRRTLHFVKASEATRLFVLAFAGMGSLLNPYLASLNNHTPAAICAVFCVSAIVRLTYARSARQFVCPADMAILGFNAALCSCFELPAALFGILAFLLAVQCDLRKTAWAFIPAALLPLAAFLITNWICTGGIKPFYMYYGTEKYEYIHNGVPSYWMNPQDLDANTESWTTYLFHCLLGHHGLFSLTPALLLIIPGFYCLLFCQPNAASSSTQNEQTPPQSTLLRPVLLIGALLSTVTLTFYLTRTANYNYGGNSVALRWMLWLTPFWWLMMVPALEFLLRTKKTQWLCLLLLAGSIFTVSWSHNRPWKPSWLYVAMEQTGIISYRTPRPPKAPPVGKTPPEATTPPETPASTPPQTEDSPADSTPPQNQ
ncbi:MAG: hypothetical protein JNL58_10785 [Planctomyces sp.]|nr:hypothetical protein [Planctomyces sp.]